MSDRIDDLAADLARSFSTGGERSLLERISMEAEALAQRGEGPSCLVAALVAADLDHLAAAGAERHHHATARAAMEQQAIGLADAAPIFSVEPGALIAVPVGPLGADGLARFCDRLLGEVLATSARRVLLVTGGLAPHPGMEEALDELAADLAHQRVKVERG
jgi:hypothetical protein